MSQSEQSPRFDCRSEHPERGEATLIYRFESRVAQPYAIATSATILAGRLQRPRSASRATQPGDHEAPWTWDPATKAVVFDVPVPRGGGFLVFNVLQRRWDARDADLQQCLASIETALADRRRVQEKVGKAKKDVEASTDRVKELERRLQLVQQEIAAFSQGYLESALARIDKLQAEMRQAYEARLAEEQSRDSFTKLLDNARSDLSEIDGRIRKDWNASADDLDTRRDEIKRRLEAGAKRQEYSIRKVGGLPLSSDVKALYYDFAPRQNGTALGLPALGDAPAILFRNRVYSVVANVVRARHAFGFSLSASAQPGPVVNIEPVRPNFAVSVLEAVRNEITDVAVTGGDEAYTDLFLPVQADIKPNDVLEVTITTERADDKDPQKRSAVVLVDKAKYPQVRALYHYNFNTGVLASNLRDSRFVKVKTRADDPVTPKVDESTYRVDTLAETRPVKPVFAFTWYWKAVDIQAPLTLAERLRPNPTAGFALTSPVDDVFLGVTHEVARNMSVFWGVHLGMVTERLPRDEVTEEHDATPPPTRRIRRPALAVGLTFNIAIVTKIFH